MACSLCFEGKDTLIDLSDDEAKQLQIATIIFKYFSYCFIEEPKTGYICRKCWCKVDIFHQFYLQIEEIQSACYKSEYVEQIKCDVLSDDTKEDESVFFANDVQDNFDNISVENDFFKNEDENNDDHRDMDDNDDDDNDEEEDEDDETVSNNKTDDESTSQTIQNDLNSSKCSKRKWCKRPKIKCDHCEQSFLTIYRVRKHLKTQHPELAFRCSRGKCVETFATIELLEKHRERYAKIPCFTCGKMIKSNGMKRHIQSVHEKTRDQGVVCDLCGRVSSSIFMHKYHVRSEHEVHGRLQCDICKEWYKNKENLRSHMKSIHVEGPQTCTICGRVSTNMKSLAKHKKIHLEGSKERFKCIVCGKGFRDRTKLKEHSYIHTGVTDAYVCQFCGKAFRFGSSMYAHRKKAHPHELMEMKCPPK